MAPAFTIFQDSPCSSSARPVRPAPSFARGVDKENIDPRTGLSRTTAKPKAKKTLGTKTKESSNAFSKPVKAARAGAAAPGFTKSPNICRASPYDLAPALLVTELTFHLTNTSSAPTPTLISGFSASPLPDFAEPEFDLHSDFIHQPSPLRSHPDSVWSQLLPATELPSDIIARDLTELPLADLTEAFVAAPKKSKNSLSSQDLTKSLFGDVCRSSHARSYPEFLHGSAFDLGIAAGSF